MKDLTNFKIIKFNYPFPTEELTERIWDKMDINETKWAVQLTMKGINDTGDSENGSWDIFFLDNKLQEKVESILKKYEIPYEIDDQTKFIAENITTFTEDFLGKLDSYLDQNLTVDDVLDRISEVGLSNITPFEKYFIDRHKDDE